MKANVIGVSRAEGISNKSGTNKPYDMASLVILQPMQTINSANPETGTRYAKTGFGYETAEVSVSPAAVVLFKDVKFPAALDLEISQDFMYGKLQSLVVGFKAA
jgi:hypothetical protein